MIFSSVRVDSCTKMPRATQFCYPRVLHKQRQCHQNKGLFVIWIWNKNPYFLSKEKIKSLFSIKGKTLLCYIKEVLINIWKIIILHNQAYSKYCPNNLNILYSQNTLCTKNFPCYHIFQNLHNTDIFVTHKVTSQFVHCRLLASYFLFPWRDPDEMSRRSILFHN